MSAGFDGLLGRLLAQAARLAVSRARGQRTDPVQRWRDPKLLWPLFTKG
jgi:hypothetical protein